MISKASQITLAAQPTCRLVTLGCKVNQYETQLVKEALLAGGYREASEDESADICVVNTCTVTATGDSKGRQLIRQLARRNPGTRTIVMGCYATREPAALAGLPGVFEVVQDKRELPDVLGRIGIVELPRGITHFDGRQRAYVKVQDGCILRCSYCIIPQVRPGLQSRDPGEIEAEVRGLVDRGFREIVLTGIHVGHFGVDTTRGRSGRPRFRLHHLFERLDRIPGQWRMRLSSIEAREINADFIKSAANCEHLCPQFHPALQSGSDSVLKRMRRRYTARQFLNTIDEMRHALDQPAFTTDAIVGFPGETAAEFGETVDVCRSSGFSKIHIFPFSPRKGTPAAEAPDQVDPQVRKARVHELEAVEAELATAYHQSLVGQDLEVLIERTAADRPGFVRGTDRRYVPVTLPGHETDIGTLVNATALSADATGIEARR
tara:strand:- start:558 stop:1862 length:1305 start_codon:yes stop_codon:yes gene_type:complete